MLEQERGDWQAALTALRHGLDVASEPERDRMETRLRNVALNWGRREPETLNTIVESLGAKSGLVTQTASWRQLRLEHASQASDVDAFADSWLAMLEGVADVRTVWIEAHQRRCRLDRWMQGMLRRYRNEVSPEVVSDLDERIARGLEAQGHWPVEPS